ncbi:aspartic peptidase domain-containing protein [Aspergillus granulosus]|uniref:Aspartic peptidase domain-containing protein n=1 Tax=Aspergillus granulosus TaxID=176169 RepID=A0ABR4H0X9_9EURO
MRQKISLIVLSTLRAAHAQHPNPSPSPSPYVMNWSTQSYGPDGPWQAVTIQVGSNKQHIALYPGANYASTIFADSICDNTTLSETCYAARAGIYNQSQSTTSTSLDQDGSLSSSSAPWNVFYWNVQGGSRQASIGDQVTLTNGGETAMSIPNVSFTTVYDTYQTYPNGRSYPVSVGYLALGAPWTRDTSSSSGLTLNMMAAWLYTSNRIPSYSYALHIGSVHPPIPGSLVLGGYDRARLIGQASSQPLLDSAGLLQIVLRDIGLGVAEGGSPFPSFTDSHRGGLFLDDQHATGAGGMALPRLVSVDPTKPYMYLPEATCNAITALFPPGYTNLTSSPAYLSFTFNKDESSSSTNNVTIRVPLQLLTLTLQEPLVNIGDRNLTYFPCFLSTDTPVLGRAFLQAAFMEVNWFEGENNGSWTIGQAPGPRLTGGEDIVAVAVNDRSLRGSEEKGAWEGSWSGYWTPLPLAGQSTGNGTDMSRSDSSLSTGAKAGIGIGVGIAGVILIGMGCWVMVLRRRRQKQNQAGIDIAHGTGGLGTGAKSSGQAFRELPVRDKDISMQSTPMELTTKDTRHPQEIMGTERVQHELE